MRLSVGEIVSATGGRLLRGRPEVEVEGASLDTRRLEPGMVFFALPGRRADGHDFLPHAARAGARAAVIAREPDPQAPAPEALVLVEDVALALRACGALARRKSRARFVAVTGSSGKTMTKELAAAGLAVHGKVHRTHGNQNNLLGVPLTLLACPEDADVAVLELGMSASGEIAALTAMVDPHAGLVTNVGPAHLAFFDSIDAVAAAKGELYAALREDAVAVVHLDDPHVRLQAARHAGARLTFGEDPRADLRLLSLVDRFVPGTRLRFAYRGEERELELRLAGGHNARNALAALALVAAAGGDPLRAAERLADVEPLPGRCTTYRLAAGVVLVDDSYNSNPAALAAVLETLRHSEPAGRKILVMGDMLELGAQELAFHREAGRRAAAAGVQIMVGVGTLVRAALEEARHAGVPETRHEPDADRAARDLPGVLRPGDLVVVKGSRATRLEIVVEALRQAAAKVS